MVLVIQFGFGFYISSYFLKLYSRFGSPISTINTPNMFEPCLSLYVKSRITTTRKFKIEVFPKISNNEDDEEYK
jgi:hypothetical protein